MMLVVVPATLLLITPLIVAAVAELVEPLTVIVRLAPLRSRGFWKSIVLLAVEALRTRDVGVKFPAPHWIGSPVPPRLTTSGVPNAEKPLAPPGS